MSNYDEAVEAAKEIILSSIVKAYKHVSAMDGNFDIADVMADAQEEVFINYLETNGFDINDSQI